MYTYKDTYYAYSDLKPHVKGMEKVKKTGKKKWEKSSSHVTENNYGTSEMLLLIYRKQRNECYYPPSLRFYFEIS